MLNPRVEQILPRLFWPVLALSLMSGLAGQIALIARPTAFTIHFFRNSVVLAAVHLTSLGWLATLFLAVGVQALSVLLHRPKAGWPASAAGQGLFFAGAMAMVAFLAGFRDEALVAGSLGALGLGYGLLVWRARRLSKGTEVRTAAWYGLRASYAYLGALLGLGGVMAIGLLRPVLPQPPISTLAFHVHLALGGFAGLAIVGLLPKLLRLFLGAKGYPAWPAWVAMGFIHAGVIIYLAAWLSGSGFLAAVASGTFVLAALCFVFQLILLARAATKPLLNSSFVTQALAALWLLVAVGMDLELACRGGAWQWAEAACYLALFGWIGGTILGTAQRIMGILAWFQRFHENPPVHQVPTAWELVDPRLAWAVPAFHSAAVALGGLGMVLGRVDCLFVSGICGGMALLCTMGLAIFSFRRGRKEAFFAGMNPYG